MQKLTKLIEKHRTELVVRNTCTNGLLVKKLTKYNYFLEALRYYDY